MVHLAEKVVQKGYKKTDLRYWKQRIRIRTTKGTYQVRLRLEGRQIWFNLNTSSASEAASRARDVYFYAKTNRIAAAVEKYKFSSSTGCEIKTVGQFVTEVLSLNTTVSEKTVAQYAGAFRQIAYEIVSSRVIRSKYDHLKYDYRGNGRAKWLNYIDSIKLKDINTDSVQEWRLSKTKSTSSSQIRQAKAFVALIHGDGEARLKLRAKLPDELPFQNVKTASPKAQRHKTIIGADGETLAIRARAELKYNYPEEYKAFVLCFYVGLRREEADMLHWKQVDLNRGLIQVVGHKYFKPKSDESEREVDLDSSVCRELAEMKSRSAGEFVLEGGIPRTVNNQYKSYYRASKTWNNLTEWLRDNGIHVQKPIHYLRKESGSYIASSFGIEAARQYLGHADIQVTSAHYSDKKGRPTIEIPQLKSQRNESKASAL